jgi:hypothetical protein
MYVQVAFWVAAEYGMLAAFSSKDLCSTIAASFKRQKLSPDLEAAALMALFKVSAKAAASAPALAPQLVPLLRQKEASRDITLSRLAAMTNTAVRYALSHFPAGCCVLVFHDSLTRADDTQNADRRTC